MSTYNGKCHCGAMEWTVNLEKDQQAHVLCHCNTCKILAGSAYSLNMIVPKSAVNFTKGQELLQVYTYEGASGNPVHCYYCGNCTAHPFHHQTVRGPETYVLRTALLEQAREEFVPAAEVMGKFRMKWVPEVAQTFETGPPE